MAPRFSIADLTYEQIESIEDATGIPFMQWGDDDQKLGKLNPLLHAAFTGESVEDMRKMTPRQWAERNTVKAGDPDPEA